MAHKQSAQGVHHRWVRVGIVVVDMVAAMTMKGRGSPGFRSLNSSAGLRTLEGVSVSRAQATARFDSVFRLISRLLKDSTSFHHARV